MILWRISKHSALDDRGGLFASARWHTHGRPIVYLAESPAGALLEALVHLELVTGAYPAHYGLLKIEAPARISRRKVETARLSQNWFKDLVETRTIGDEWLASRSALFLRVPSVLVLKLSMYCSIPDIRLPARFEFSGMRSNRGTHDYGPELPFQFLVDAFDVSLRVGHVLVLVFGRQLEGSCGLVRDLAGFYCGLGGHNEVACEFGVFPEVRPCLDGIGSNEPRVSHRGRGMAGDHRVNLADLHKLC